MRLIRLGHNAVPSCAKKLLNEVWKSGQFSPGPKVREFEEKFAKLHGAKHAVFVNSGTDALRLSLLAMKEKYSWKDGDAVAVPSLTFVATVNVILQAGLSPMFVDVGMYDFTMNADNLEHKLTCKPKTLRAIIPVHLFGNPCSEAVFKLAQKLKVAVLEDSCETILNPLRGDASCYSTYMAHHLTTGVGGFAVTNDDKLNGLIRSYANHGRDMDYVPGYKKSTDIRKRFRFERVGHSCRGTEFEAALGISQLDGLEKNVEKRRAVAEELDTALYDYWAMFQTGLSLGSTCMMYPIVIKDRSWVKKHDFCLHLEKNGIETRDMMPITNQACYKGLVSEDDFPVAKAINERGFYIPINPGMTDKDIKQIKNAFASYFKSKR